MAKYYVLWGRLALLLFCCSFSSSLFSMVAIQGQTMGTTYSVKIPKLPQGVSTKTLKIDIDKSLEQVNDQMSTYRSHSELSRFNQYKKTDWFAVSEATAFVSQRALDIGKMTSGAFDVTLGALVNLWGFGPSAQPNRVPSDKAIAQKLKQIGYKKFSVRQKPPAIKKSAPSLYVDLSGIAKGYGVDVIAEQLMRQGIKSFMVEIGGEVRTQGKKPGNQHWQIAVEQPVVGSRKIHKVLSLENESLATSGDYRNYHEQGSKRFSHLIDPRNGKPISHHLASVSIVSATCADADALATSFMVLGLDKSMKIARKNQIAAYFIVRSGKGFVVKQSPAFEKVAKRK